MSPENKSLPRLVVLAKILGGELTSGRRLIAPYPGRKDRLLEVCLDPLAPDGFVASPLPPESGTPENCRRYVLKKIAAAAKRGKRPPQACRALTN